MTSESIARQYAENLETYLLAKSNNNLGKEISEMISNLKTTPWDKIFSKTMIYRILSDAEKFDALKTKLPFLTNDEHYLVKQHVGLPLRQHVWFNP